MNTKADTVLACVDMKQAALYFKYVVPDMTYYAGRTVGKCLDAQLRGSDPNQVLKEMSPYLSIPLDLLLPPDLRESKTFMQLAIKVPIWNAFNFAATKTQTHPRRADTFDVQLAKLVDAMKSLIRVDLLNDKALELSYDAFIGRYNLYLLPVIMPPEWLSDDDDADDIEGDAEVAPVVHDCRVSLANVNLIDTSNASWEQILAFREDIESHEKVARLRRFVSAEYAGKDDAFIEHDLHTRMEKHDEAAKKFGFDQKTTILEAVFSSKVLQASIAGAGIMTVLGRPWEAIAAGVVSTVFEIGNAKLKLERRRFEFDQSVANNPLGYIIAAKEQLEKPLGITK